MRSIAQCVKTTKKAKANHSPQVPRDCALCPRLVAYRNEIAVEHPAWFGGAVPSFGDPSGQLMVLGLAPGKSGAHRTGRAFTGDGSGGLLFQMLHHHGFANDAFDNRADDGLTLHDCLITNAVRCVPPANKPTAAELTTCRTYLQMGLQGMTNLRAVLCLGRLAHDSLLRALDRPLAAHRFAHGARHSIGRVQVFDSYHCSRYNLNTRRLTPGMFNAVFADVRAFLGQNPPPSATGQPPQPTL